MVFPRQPSMFALSPTLKESVNLSKKKKSKTPTGFATHPFSGEVFVPVRSEDGRFGIIQPVDRITNIILRNPRIIYYGPHIRVIQST